MLVSISGQDKPGLMAALMALIVKAESEILDMGQAVIHAELALSVLLRVRDFDALADEIRHDFESPGFAIRLSKVSADSYQQWAQGLARSPLILTLLAQGGGAEPVHAISALTHRYGLNIDTVRRLTLPHASVALDADPGTTRLGIEMRLGGELQHSETFQAELLTVANAIGFDFSLQRDTVFRRNRRLVAFDMDSTLIAVEVMDELAKRYGVGAQVVEITAAAMAGQLDFQQSFRRRAALLRGMPEKTLHEVATSVTLSSGAHRLIRALKHFGYRTAVLSGGFQYVGEHLQQELGIDYVFANRLEVVDGVMTGEVVGEIVDAQRKADLLLTLAQREGISLQQTIAVGDGANALPMLQRAGLGVAFHAKSIVRESASHSISNFGLDAILYLIGFNDLDVAQALASTQELGAG